jgi:hypothetical protein
MILVVTSHSSYEDILQIQSDYIKKLNADIKTVLLYDIPTTLPFDRVIIYDPTLSWTDRMSFCLSQIEDTHVLFIKDMDILLNMDINFINDIVLKMIEHNIDRVDLKEQSTRPLNDVINVNNDTVIIPVHDTHYRFNVGPALWKTSTFLDIMKTFPNRGYRDIEFTDVQEYCLKFNMCNVHSQDEIQSAFFKVPRQFTTMHITSVNMLINEENNGMDSELKDVYKTILSTYSLTRVMKSGLYGWS